MVIMNKQPTILMTALQALSFSGFAEDCLSHCV